MCKSFKRVCYIVIVVMYCSKTDRGSVVKALDFNPVAGGVSLNLERDPCKLLVASGSISG